MVDNDLFKKIKIGGHELTHRIVLAPMTRIRACRETLAPTDLTVQYYSQRASTGGLLITEAIHISPEATPVWTIYPAVRKHGDQVPGIWTDEQTHGWKKVVQAVHEKGAQISCQLLHTGRVAQPDIGNHSLIKDTNCSLPPVCSSAVPIEPRDEQGNQYNWDQPSTTPRALETDEIARVVEDYKNAARNALKAGFDFIEIHAAHGYLIEQFLCDGVNQRTDEYGSSIENRCRFLFEIIEALVGLAGANRVGVRLSPTAIDSLTSEPTQTYFGVTDTNPEELYAHVIRGLNKYLLAYLLLTEPRVGGLSAHPKEETAYQHPLRNFKYRELYEGVLIGAGGFTPQTAETAIQQGAYDLIAFGRWFLANPDLPDRIKHGCKLNVYDRATFYGGSEKGYTDYPGFCEAKNIIAQQYPLIKQTEIG